MIRTGATEPSWTSRLTHTLPFLSVRRHRGVHWCPLELIQTACLPGAFIFDTTWTTRRRWQLSSLGEIMPLESRGRFSSCYRRRLQPVRTQCPPRGEEILGLGQSIGLHSVHIEAGGQSLEAQLASDFAAAQRVHPEHVGSFSWHNPTPDLLERAAGRAVEAGLVNVYAERFTRQIRYASDSNMRNRPADFLELLRPDGPDALQLLLHPLYWVAGGSTWQMF